MTDTKTAYFDCSAGVCGNMIIGALLDAGLEKDFLIKELKKIPLAGYQISFQKIKKSGRSAGRAFSHFEIKVTTRQPRRNLNDIKKIIAQSRLATDVKKKIIKIFTALAQVESRVHAIPVQEVHFHEIGAVDTILDIAGAVIGFKKLGLKNILSSALNLGAGFIKTQHGLLPVPAPATAQIVKGLPAYQSTGSKKSEKTELTTPTGAIILKTFAGSFGPPPLMKIEKIGLGAGTRNIRVRPNILRLLIGRAVPSHQKPKKGAVPGRCPLFPPSVLKSFSMKIRSLFLIFILAAALLSAGCSRKIPQSDGVIPTIKERSLYEEYVEQFDFLYDKLKNKNTGRPSNLEDIKNEISRINQMDKNLRKSLAAKYRVDLKEIDRIIFRVLDNKLKEKGWSEKGETKKS